MANGAQSSTGQTTIVIPPEDTAIVLQGLTVTNAIEAKRISISPLLPTSCIFRVPHLLRRHNPDAYQPDNVSIGPFHRGRRQLQSMEKVKRWYLQSFLSRIDITVGALIQEIIKRDEEARAFYSEPLGHLNKTDFVEMMVLDGCFLIELFRNFMHENPSITDDPIFNMDCMFKHICHDLLLLENQLPWFVVESLYNLTLVKYPLQPSLRVLMLTVLSTQPPLYHNCVSYLSYLDDQSDDDEILHILDLLRRSIVVPFKQYAPSANGQSQQTPALIGLGVPSAITLSEGGIKFKSSSDKSKSIMNVTFKKEVLTFPRLAIGELTGPLFRNLIAFEQCYRDRPNEITSYAILMDKLISSSKDMEFLGRKKIVVNTLSAEDGSEFFNKLCNDTTIKEKEFIYQGLCIQVNRSFENKWNGWLERFRIEKLASPFTIFPLFVAFLFLGLAVTQTAFAIRAYYVPPKSP